MPSHKSPSSQRYAERSMTARGAYKLAIAQFYHTDLEPLSSKEILRLRRQQSQTRSEGMSYHLAVAMPKHPKAGRHLSNPKGRATLTGEKMEGSMYDHRKITRQIEGVTGPNEKSPSTVGRPRHITAAPYVK